MNRTRQMSIDVREFSETSSRMLEQRLERMWRQKQAEKDERMKVFASPLYLLGLKQSFTIKITITISNMRYQILWVQYHQGKNIWFGT